MYDLRTRPGAFRAAASPAVRPPDWVAVDVRTPGVEPGFGPAEDARLASSPEWARLAVEALLDYTYDWDLRTGTLVRSAGFARVTGHVGLPATPEAWQPLLHPDDLARLLPDAARVMADPTCRDHTSEYRLRHADGHWLWLRERMIIVRGPDGRAERIVGGATDITARVAAESARALADATLMQTVAATGSVVWELDLVTGRRTASATLRAICGVEDLEEIAAADLLHPDHWPRHCAVIEAALDAPASAGARVPWRSRYRIRRPDDGRLVWIDEHGLVERELPDPPDDTSSAPSRWARRLLGVATDVTDRQVTTMALETSERRLRRLLEHVGSAILELDAHGCVVYANPAAERLVGTPVTALLGRRFDDAAWAVTAPDGTPIAPDALPGARALRGEVVTGARHTVRRAGDDARRVVAVNAVPVADPEDGTRIIGVLCSIEDVTEEWTAHEAERRARRRSEVLQGLTAALGRARSVEDVARIALDDTAQALGYAYGTFCLLDAAGEWFTTVRKLGGEWAAGAPWPDFRNTPGTPAHEAVTAHVPVILLDRSAYRGRYPALDTYDTATGQYGHLVYPLLVSDETHAVQALGFLSFDLDAPRAVDAEEVRFHEALAAASAQAVMRVQLAEAERAARAAAERDAARLAELARLSEALAPLRSVAEVSRTVLAHAVSAAGAEGGGVMRLSADGLLLDLVELVGYDETIRGAFAAAPVDAPVPARDALRTGEPIYLESLAAYTAAGYLTPPPHAGGNPGGAWAALPLAVADDQGVTRPLGVLVLTFAAPEAIAPEARGFLESLARHCAQAIDRAALAEAEQAAHARIAAAGRFLGRVTDVAPDILYVHDIVARRNVWLNQAMFTVLGFDRTEVAARGADLMRSLLHPDEAAMVDAHYARLATLADGEVATLTYRMRHADGSWRWLESREMVFVRDEAGRPRQVVGAATDLTERRASAAARAEAEAAFDESEQRFRLMQEASPDGVLLLEAVRDAAGRIVDFAYRYANPVAQRFQAPGGTLTMGERLSERQPSFRGSPLFASYVGVVEGGQPFVDEVRYAGEWIDGTFRIMAVRTGDDELAITFSDVSAQVDALESARAANRAKAEFLATMSHELRTPLNAIQGHVQLLTLGIHGPITEAQRATLDRVDRAQRHLLGIINDVLNYARLEAGRVEYAITDIDLLPVVEETIALLEPQAAARSMCVSVDVQPPETAVVVRADREKLAQVLLNLLGNAIKFSGPGTDESPCPITVRITPGGEDAAWHVLEVVDCGVGIPAARVDAVFEPFVQVRADLARPAEGTGLGLAISRDLVRGMGGELGVESVEGEGSTFRLMLPIAVGA
ncbi:MAG: PAS domain-containing protein [Gemmatimonadaceae bacterium]|jgi:PAS domain S-box-containing protein|nr:PAS domain-containing protein [Gemmatimonadaceae bacterium]